MKDKLLEELKKRFRPEFINRLDGMVVFHSLSKETSFDVDLMLKGFKQLDEKEIVYRYPKLLRIFGRKGFDEVSARVR